MPTKTWAERFDSVTAVFEKAFFSTLGKHNTENNAAPAVSPGRQTELARETQNLEPVVDVKDGQANVDDDNSSEWAVKGHQKKYFAYLRSPRFWVAIVVGQIISLCLTCTNTMNTELGMYNGSMPLLQNLLNYAILAIVYNIFMWYKYGFKKWFRILVRDSWRFFLLAFFDVEGNYFVSKAYQYTNMLSAALLDNFAIVVVVILSLVFLHVRYHWSQYIGILVTIGGMAILIVSDKLTGRDNSAANPIKGDLFVLLGAACYGFSNTFEEFLVSERPIYEVLGNLSFWAVIINGVQLAIFERDTVRQVHWNGKIGGYFSGYILTMVLLYHLAPVMFRISSATFYNLNTLTSDFWALLVGTQAFGYRVYWLYGVGFTCTILGIICYCAAPMSDLGESLKPWLGKDQELGVSGFGTARRARERITERDLESGDSPEAGRVERLPSPSLDPSKPTGSEETTVPVTSKTSDADSVTKLR